MKKYLSIMLMSGLFFSCNHETNKIVLSPLFTDGMVLQRNTKVNIWGQSSRNTEINIISEWGQELKLKSDSTGIWKGKILTPKAGGPFYLKIISENQNITIEDIMIGEVWIASGQSNMEMTMNGFPPKELILNSENEILNANYPNIRMFDVERSMKLKPSNKLSGSWIKTSPKEVESFSATAYFFAQEVHKHLDIPIGIIHSSWGGTPAEAWTSGIKLKELGFFVNTLENMEKSDPEEVAIQWFNKFKSIDIPQKSPSEGVLKEYYKNLQFSDGKLNEFELDDQSWQTVFLPGRFDTLKLWQFDGVIWLRKEIFLNDISSDYNLHIEYIDDMDKTYFNGNLIGDFSGYGYHREKRNYNVPKSILKKGKNVIAIRAVDIIGEGEFGREMNLTNNNGKIISIEGLWKYKPVAEIYENKFYTYETKLSLTERPYLNKLSPFLPKVLFNGMINPLIPYTIKGVIWYQGEANVGRHNQYSSLFPGMIEDWRNKWNNEFPFYFVQIAPFRYAEDPLKNVSQELREAQRKTLELPKTGMVVTLDIGDFDNIHPANKKDVGKRLARLALVNDYDFDLAPLGPILNGSEIFKNTIKLSFTHVGSGLKYFKDQVNQFEIAGSDMNFFKANVSVEENNIFVFSSFVKEPMHVRYAWSDTPIATLFSGDGFPASSFKIEIK